MKFIKQSFHKWIEATLILVVAIFLIAVGVSYDASDNTVISLISNVFGVFMVVNGVAAIVVAMMYGVKNKVNVATLCVPGVTVLALGISLLVIKYAEILVALLICLIPYLILSVGALLVIDGIFTIIRIKQSFKEGNYVVPVLTLVSSAVVIALGVLCVTEIITFRAQSIILGILLALFAILLVALTIAKPKYFEQED